MRDKGIKTMIYKISLIFAAVIFLCDATHASSAQKKLDAHNQEIEKAKNEVINRQKIYEQNKTDKNRQSVQNWINRRDLLIRMKPDLQKAVTEENARKAQTKVEPEMTSIASDARIVNIKKESDDFYTGQGRAVSGETLYFGMERVTARNKKGIDNFMMLTDKYFNSNTGEATLVTSGCSRGREVTFEKPGNYVTERFGRNQAEFENTKKLFCFGSAADMEKRAQLLSSASAGTNYIHRDVGDYISYISKDPITGPIDWNLSENATVLEYMTFAQKLIILVGSKLKFSGLSDTFDNRGVGKTAPALIAGTHKAVSLPLHGFTSAVAKKFLGMKRFQVRANMNMAPILEKVFKEGEFERFKKDVEGLDKGFRIPVDTMIDFYTGKRK